MKSEFVDTMTLEDMDTVKEKLKETIYSEFGGEQSFKEWAHSLGEAIHKELTLMSS
jgi:hypothetical protein